MAAKGLEGLRPVGHGPAWPCSHCSEQRAREAAAADAGPAESPAAWPGAPVLVQAEHDHAVNADLFRHVSRVYLVGSPERTVAIAVVSGLADIVLAEGGTESECWQRVAELYARAGGAFVALPPPPTTEASTGENERGTREEAPDAGG